MGRNQVRTIVRDIYLNTLLRCIIEHLFFENILLWLLIQFTVVATHLMKYEWIGAFVSFENMYKSIFFTIILCILSISLQFFYYIPSNSLSILTSELRFIYNKENYFVLTINMSENTPLTGKCWSQ